MDCRLYLITPPRLDDVEAFDRALAEALDAGDVAAVQFRFKPASEDEIRAWTTRLLPTVQARGVMALMNDRPDLARELGCDGVHIGADDASIAESRRILGPDAVIGVTCKDSRHRAMEAAEAGCDYVAFGAFFDTTTKATDARPDPEILTIWQEAMQTPCVAIGGITVDNAASLVAAGADYLAVSAGVWRHADGPAAAVRAFGDLLKRAH